VAETVVDVLEAVEIHEHDCDLRIAPPRRFYRVLQAIFQQIAIRQARERVVIRLIFELFLIAHQIGHVVDDADVMRGHALRVRHRRDEELVPEERAVLAIVAHDDARFHVRFERAADRREPFLISVRAVQEAAILADDLARVITRDALERRIRILDHVRAIDDAGDQNRVHARVQRAALQTQREFGALVIGDVVIRTEHADGLPFAVEQRQLARNDGAQLVAHHDVALVMHLRHGRDDDLFVVRAHQIRERAPRQVEIRLADDLLVVRETRIARERIVAAEIAQLAVLPEHALRNVVDDRFEHLVRAARFGFRVDAVGHVVRQHEDARPARVDERVMRHVRAHDRSVLAAIAPDARRTSSRLSALAPLAAFAAAARKTRGEAVEVVRMMQIAQRHVHELRLVEAEVFDRGLIHGNEAHRLAIDDPHRHRMRLEHAAKALVAALSRARRAELLARLPLAAREEPDQHGAAREHRADEQQHGAARRPRGLIERADRRVVEARAHRRELVVDALLILAERNERRIGPCAGRVGARVLRALEGDVGVVPHDGGAGGERIECAHHAGLHFELRAQAAFERVEMRHAFLMARCGFRDAGRFEAAQLRQRFAERAAIVREVAQQAHRAQGARVAFTQTADPLAGDERVGAERGQHDGNVDEQTSGEESSHEERANPFDARTSNAMRGVANGSTPD